MIQRWMNQFSVAIIENDINKIAHLVENFPLIEDISKAKEVLILLLQAREILQKAKNDTLIVMQKLKHTKQFITTNEVKKNRFIG